MAKRGFGVDAVQLGHSDSVHGGSRFTIVVSAAKQKVTPAKRYITQVTRRRVVDLDTAVVDDLAVSAGYSLSE
jgi:acetolactate synthase small subunit